MFYEVADLVVALGGDGDDAVAAGGDLLYVGCGALTFWGQFVGQPPRSGAPSARQLYRRRVGYRTANRVIVLRVILEESE